MYVEALAVALFIPAGLGAVAPAGVDTAGRAGRAQSDWQVYSPPDRSFSVEVPKTPHDEAESYEGLDESTPGGWKPVHSYAAVASLERLRAYFISVFEVDGARGADDKAIDEFIYELAGEDKRLTRSEQISVDGLRGRDYTLSSRGADEPVFMRVRLVQAGARLYVLTYVSDNSGDLDSPSALRFLNSLRAGR